MSGIPRLTAWTSRRTHLDQKAGPGFLGQLDRIHAWSSAGSAKIAASSRGDGPVCSGRGVGTAVLR